MRVLGIDTATFSASAAVVEADDDGRFCVLAQGALDTSGRGDDLLVLIDRICREAAVDPRQLDAVAVGAGPGSFTGLRIGMATAKGIAFAARCPLWLASSLAAMAAEAAAQLPAAPPTMLVPVLDARRAEVFAGFYARDERGSLEAAAPEQVLAPHQLQPAVRTAAAKTTALAYVGDALDVHPSLAPLASQWLAVARTPSAAWVVHEALRGSRVDHLASGRPAYLRPAEAEVMYPDGVPGALRPEVRAAALSDAVENPHKTNSR